MSKEIESVNNHSMQIYEISGVLMKALEEVHRISGEYVQKRALEKKQSHKPKEERSK